jgi:hypothetical protein
MPSALNRLTYIKNMHHKMHLRMHEMSCVVLNQYLDSVQVFGAFPGFL